MCYTYTLMSFHVFNGKKITKKHTDYRSVVLDKKTLLMRFVHWLKMIEARTEVAKLKEHLEDIERALTAGVSRTTIHEKLCQYGLKMTKGSFLNRP